MPFFQGQLKAALRRALLSSGPGHSDFFARGSSLLNIFTHPRFRVGWILIAISTIASLASTVVRWNYENAQVNTQITVDYDDTRTMSDAFQVGHKDLLKQLQKVGVTGVALYNLSLANLRDNGRVVVLTREEAEAQYPDANWKKYIPAYRFLITADPGNSILLQQVLEHLKEQSQPSLMPKTVILKAATPAQRKAGQDIAEPQFGILIPSSRQLLSDARIGFDPAQVKVVQDLGLRIVARLPNTLNLTLDRLRLRLDEAQAAGARMVIFSEDEVLGYSSMIPIVSRELKNRQMLFGAIEFSKQRGLDEMMKRSGGMLVRVHSVSGDEAAKAKRDVLVERYVRAIKERNIRVAYVRLFPQLKGDWEMEAPVKDAGVTGANTAGANTASEAGGATPITPTLKQNALRQNVELIAQIASELKRQPIPGLEALRPGLHLADAQGFRDYPEGWLATDRIGTSGVKILLIALRFLAGLGAVGAFWLLVQLGYDLPRGGRTFLLIACTLACAVLSLSAGAGAKLMALGVGCLMTPVAVLWGGLPEAWDAWRIHQAMSPRTFAANLRRGTAFRIGVAALLRTSFLTLCGGFMTVALLNKWTYMSKTDEFLGEKATQLFPLLLVAVAMSGKIFPHRVMQVGAAAPRALAFDRVRKTLSEAFTVRYLLIGLAVLIVGYVWIARTGNDSGMDISPLELKMRALLEEWLITRPRTKEVFIGHPALILAVFFGLRRHWVLFLGASVAATLGQVDLYNTMCHIHTPLFYSILRSIHALWLGILIGGVALWIFDIALDRYFPGQITEPSDRRREDLEDNIGVPMPLLAMPSAEETTVPPSRV